MEQESQIRRLRLSMETYREILVLTNGVLLWEKQWHPTAIIGGELFVHNNLFVSTVI
ncbi:unnamed protein product [Acanthoscelides obtectus]|uniref:Uncharacterized protein n=1 Tax=Acanthoscelides obtectus TaxID=200917 RepID=A0A9P0K5H9_ACAOB|nr:unnamed protein product [Acanthoscelides obtectus]CAK1622605.1 hypothetical protein AOBTE_LOCUS1585 [Acanthoscelides obtectus]